MAQTPIRAQKKSGGKFARGLALAIFRGIARFSGISAGLYRGLVAVCGRRVASTLIPAQRAPKSGELGPQGSTKGPFGLLRAQGRYTSLSVLDTQCEGLDTLGERGLDMRKRHSVKALTVTGDGSNPCIMKYLEPAFTQHNSRYQTQPFSGLFLSRFAVNFLTLSLPAGGPYHEALEARPAARPP